MIHSFFGGIHPDGKKNATRQKSIEPLPAPAQVILPLLRSGGVFCSPSVKKGDRVLPGQVIASAPEGYAPLRATISGMISAVEPRLHPNGSDVPSVVIQNDFRDPGEPPPRPDPENLEPDELAEQIEAAGVIGPGGTAFFPRPPASAAVDTLIVNGTECEPYITRAHRLMLEFPDEILAGTRFLMKALGLKTAFIGIQGNQPDAIELLRRRLPIKHSDIAVLALRTRYPQGSVRQLVQSVTGRQIPPGGGPGSVGCFVTGADTVWSICNAVRRGLPAVRRVITVSGPGVGQPKNLNVPVGTPLSDLLAAAGGLRKAPNRVILGGPMTGLLQNRTSAPVLWDTDALLVLDPPKPDPAELICIRCGKCVSVCPMRLLPLFLYARCGKEDGAGLRELNLSDCIECGSCSYVCPGRLPLAQAFRREKQKISQAGGEI